MSLSKLLLAATLLPACGVWAESSASGSSSAPVRVALSANFGLYTGVPDLRYKRDIYEDILGERKPVPAQRYRFISQDFNLDFLLKSEGGYSSAIQVALGFRNAGGGDEESPEGSEFSGYRLSLKQSMAGGRLLSSLGYGLLRSDYLRLHARHHEYRVRLDYVPDPTALNPKDAPFFVRLGPELIYSQTSGADTADRYGLQWAIHALVRYQGALADDMPASLGIESYFSRIDSYEIGDSREGGAGLLALSPVMEFMLMENLWVGLRVAIPLQRPEGREEAFPDAQLPGLYGSSFQFLMRTATF